LVASFFSASLLLALQLTGSTAALPSIAAEAIRREVHSRAGALRSKGEAALGDLLEEFYTQRGYGFAWADARSLTAARDLVVRIAASHEDGLCPMRYEVPWLRGHLAAPAAFPTGPDPAADVDLSTALLRYTVHLGLGHAAADDRASSSRPLDVLSTFRAMRQPEMLPAALQALEPRHAEYRELRRALAALRAIVLRGGWPAVPSDLVLRPGDEAAMATLQTVAARLQWGGDLTAAEWPADPRTQMPADARTPIYEGTLVDGVRRFQKRHGLLVDGIVGRRTVAALNVPASARLEQIEINMDRYRRLPDDLGFRHVRVNIPEFQVRVVEGGETLLSTRAVVGLPSMQTPVFSDRISYLVFNPYWNVPDGILYREIAPKAAEDPGYVASQNFEILSGWEEDAQLLDPATVDWEAERLGLRIRQRPGPENALGLVKFMFPNRYSVYLHDTPSKWLFDRPRRALSHGCVRVENPESLAEVLLSHDEGWTTDRVLGTMRSRNRQVVALNTPVPVHLLYFTAWVDDGDSIHFRDDVYGRDKGARAWMGCRTQPG
jgi:L,D-transpeptidase YcbB